jgi:multimeric flavodoxin WrbA
MKILGISCSPRKQGNTVILLEEVLRGARKEGADVELYRVADKTIAPCRGCMACWKTGECPIEDDMKDLGNRMIEADGIVFGTPVYYYNMTAQAKIVVDRTIALGRPGRDLANKVGGVVAVAGSLGLVDALKDLYFYFVTRQMLPANYVAAYGGAEGEVKDLEKCMQACNDLGRQMVQIAARKFRYPEEIERPCFAFGTHTR